MGVTMPIDNTKVISKLQAGKMDICAVDCAMDTECRAFSVDEDKRECKHMAEKGDNLERSPLCYVKMRNGKIPE